MQSPRESCSFCPLPRFSPDFQGPVECQDTGERVRRRMEDKAELHRVLQAVQSSADYGTFFCESFRDPRRFHMDDYWEDVCDEAIGIDELHQAVGKVDGSPLTDHAVSRLNRFSRLLERLVRRIDRVVLSSS